MTVSEEGEILGISEGEAYLIIKKVIRVLVQK